MPKLILIIGLIAMTNAYTYAQTMRVTRVVVPAETAAKAAQYERLMEVAQAIAPKERL